MLGILLVFSKKNVFMNLEYNVFKMVTRQNQPHPRVCYFLTLENRRFRAGVVLVLSRVVV